MDLDELLQIDPLNQLKMLMNIGVSGQTFDQTPFFYVLFPTFLNLTNFHFFKLVILTENDRFLILYD
ncbi:hypothetical protein BpHYR1_050169 [Brachionus plicatilis]|uniref:Uncharacterized protein n=1 Tax=Brachionus plicatilis TaxID=10195 RepID=A0A3M7PHR5_BRAPC|nr:hypothetical protein BpHYR1_050169 [Brachionus plicatilis]